MATPPFAPLGWRFWVDDLANDLAGRTSCSMPKPSRSMLKKHRRQSSEVESMPKNNAQDTILATAP